MVQTLTNSHKLEEICPTPRQLQKTKELGQYPALLTSCLVNNSHVKLIQLVYKNVTYQTSAQTALNVLWTQCLQTAVREPVEGRLEQPCVVRMLSACWTVKQVTILMLLGKNGFASITGSLFSIKTDWTKRSAIQDQTSLSPVLIWITSISGLVGNCDQWKIRVEFFSLKSAYIFHVALNLIPKQFSLYFLAVCSLFLRKKEKNSNLKQY